MASIYAQQSSISGILSPESIRETLEQGLSGKFSGQKVLILIPDHTRSLPLPSLFRSLIEILQDAKKITCMVALGTHPALSEENLNRLVGISSEERKTKYSHVSLLNHAWDDPAALTSLGIIEKDEIQMIAGEKWHKSLPDTVGIDVNKVILDNDHILILGPTFPHEVVGFSGGVKYIFPGISGAEMINATHWLGALSCVVGTIGVKDTPVRDMINVAAKHLKTPVTLIALAVEGDGLRGIFIGDYLSPWSLAADLSAKLHIHWCEKPFQRVLSCAPSMYDELWTAAKAMYKIEPAVAIGGEVIIYAPHLAEVSLVHGKYIYEAGYHILPYFLSNWEQYRNIPLGVLAHSTHLRGSGVMNGESEKPNVSVILASKISPEDCAKLNLGYLDPSSIDHEDWQEQEDQGILYVPKAGEILYRVRS